MLGLKLNHVSKRGHWRFANRIHKNTAMNLWWRKCYQQSTKVMDICLLVFQKSWHCLEYHHNFSIPDQYVDEFPDSKVNAANMGPTWGRQHLGGFLYWPHEPCYQGTSIRKFICVEEQVKWQSSVHQQHSKFETFGISFVNTFVHCAICINRWRAKYMINFVYIYIYINGNAYDELNTGQT